MNASFYALLWHANRPDGDGETVTLDDLERISKAMTGPLPIKVEFDESVPPVGYVMAMTCLGGALLTYGVLNEEGRKAVEFGNLRPVPGYIRDMDTQEILKLYAVGLTAHPAIPDTWIVIQ